MENHILILFLCVLGFLKEFRPSEPFLSPFLNGPKNFTETEINNEIYPIGTYSYTSLLIVTFLLTDWLRYKPIILLQGLSGVFTWAILLWGNGISLMQVAQVSYGLFSACDVAWSSYLYAKVEKKNYQKATAQTKASILISKAGSGLVAQVLVMYHVLDYEQLNYLTLSALSLSTIWTCLLPPVVQSTFFNRRIVTIEENLSATEELSPLSIGTTSDGIATVELGKKDPPQKVISSKNDSSYSLQAIFSLWRDEMKNLHTFKWSLWSAFSLCGYLQVTYYIQLLWQAVINADSQNVKLYHGFSNSFNSLAGAYALYMIYGALCTYAVGYINLNWTRYGEVILALSAIAQGGFILFSSSLQSQLIIHYVVYALFKILYQVSNTIVSSEIAKSLKCDSYGLVFGANQFFALVGQSVFTLLVTKAFNLDIRNQFFLYGAYFIVLGTGFAIASAISLFNAKFMS